MISELELTLMKLLGGQSPPVISVYKLQGMFFTLPFSVNFVGGKWVKLLRVRLGVLSLMSNHFYELLGGQSPPAVSVYKLQVIFVTLPFSVNFVDVLSLLP